MGDKSFVVTLCCPAPREGFGRCDKPAKDELEELRRFLKQGVDVVVFPEGFLREERAEEAKELIRSEGKWVVTGTESPDLNLSVAIFSPNGELVYTHRKTALTDGDLARGNTPGSVIDAFDMPFCTVGTPLCYEIHFPEISRIMALAGAKLLINPVGTGMWHKQQLFEWTTVARARAIENRAFVVGCTHFCDAVPMAYAFEPDGTQLGLMTEWNGAISVKIDLDKITERDWLRHRTPSLYGALAKE